MSSANPPPTLHVRVPSEVPIPMDHDGDYYNHSNGIDDTHLQVPDSGALSPASSGHGDREVANRLNDDLELMRAERMVSRQAREGESRRSRSKNRSAENLEDVFDTVAGAGATPTPAVITAPKTTWLTRTWAGLRKFPRVLRYIVYSIFPAILLLIPIFLDLFAYNGHQDVGEDRGVRLLWFGIWLEVVWLSLWATRVITCLMPYAVAWIADTIGSSNHRKWRDIGRQLEFPTAMFIWMLVVLVTYNPILKDHRIDKGEDARDKDSVWISIVYKIILAFFILATLNFAEKILIQWIASSFHRRTYSLRIYENHMRIECLVALYTYAKTCLEAQDPVWNPNSVGDDSSGIRTPMKAMKTNARQAWSKVGNAANRFAGDITGRRILKGNHPRKVVMELLRSTNSSYTLARVFYRTFVRPGRDTITLEDMLPAFPNQDEAEACFAVFDKDFNGDISMEELEMVCSEIHLEKKAIAASLKDLDSVIQKLDKVFMFIIVVIVIIVFISIISNSAAAALTSTGTVILGLSWLLQATAQEFLQSILFVFVKHPFDVGDRVTIYGNTGSLMRGDDYYVLEVSLLYTEFKKMEGHVVQAPNSILNTLFILNQRRSQGLADPVNLTLRFGTTEAQIEELKDRMRDFCIKNQRDYAPRIISEVRTIDEVYSINMNIIFFHKSNFQNELLRLTRHNKFAVELMHQMDDMGIQGPRLMAPGGRQSMPMFWSQVPGGGDGQHQQQQQPGQNGPQQQQFQQPPIQQAPPPSIPSPSPSDFLRRRHRADSRATVVESGVDFQDVYMNRRPEPLGGHGIHRLASIRQRDEEEEEEEEEEQDEKKHHHNNDMASELDQRLEKMSSRAVSLNPRPSRDGGMSHTSGRRAKMNMFGRARSRSVVAATQPPGGNQV
ncbi:Mechanosensitive ion channel-domain-containing protein [Copromyces sp. CBS 386.78]|nr:Mechanosensitive ion channel-domain-containing protein [Copromyces sp. CBS 386.78]